MESGRTVNKTFAPKDNVSCVGGGGAGGMQGNGFESRGVGEVDGAQQLGGQVSQ